MGERIIVECLRCDYQKSFLLGVGMMYSSLEHVISLVSPTRHDEVLKILQTQVIHAVNYEHKLFVCPKRNRLAGRFDYLISYNDNQIYRPYFRCPKCRIKLVPISETVTDLYCPQCGEKSLNQHVGILWD